VKHILKKIGRDEAEQRRPEQDADDDLAHRGRLPDALRHDAAETASQHDHGQLQQGEEQQRLGLMDGKRLMNSECGRAQIMPPFTEMIWPLR